MFAPTKSALISASPLISVLGRYMEQCFDTRPAARRILTFTRMSSACVGFLLTHTPSSPRICLFLGNNCPRGASLPVASPPFRYEGDTVTASDPISDHVTMTWGLFSVLGSTEQKKPPFVTTLQASQTLYASGSTALVA